MKATLKPLGLAVAVAAVSAGYAGVTNAQEYNAGNLGDLAIIPYYTVQADWVTGVHITNSSSTDTVVVKLRLRRGDDSMDALDFNIVLSPRDMWTGLVKGDDESNITLNTGDKSCTAPLTGGQFPMPVNQPGFPAFNEGAMEGYIEVIGMGAQVTGELATAALHDSTGVPADCTAVETNFFRAGVSLTTKGIIDSSHSVQTGLRSDDTPYTEDNDYIDVDNVLSVSYFIRDNASGVEFGSNAVHVTDFNNVSMMSNQARLVAGTYDPYGFYVPDLDGGSSIDGNRGRFDANVRPALGVLDVLNDWSVGNVDNQIQTDWVITFPGQYVMLDFANYVASLNSATATCDAGTNATGSSVVGESATPTAGQCDYRDLPVTASFGFWDREEQTTSTPEDGLVISPASGAAPTATLLPNEVNVIKWDASGLGNDNVEGVLNSDYGQTFDVSAFGAENGWANLAVSATTTKSQAVCALGNVAGGTTTCTAITNTPVPMVGFTAWQRTLPSDPSASYGRIIEHSFTVSN